MIFKTHYATTVTSNRDFLSTLKKRRENKSDETYRIIYKTEKNIHLDTLLVSDDCRIELNTGDTISIGRLIIKHPASGHIRFDCRELQIDCIEADDGIEDWFSLMLNLDRIIFIDCEARSNLMNQLDKSAKPELMYINSLIPPSNDFNYKISDRTQASISHLIELLGGRQRAIDICDKLVVPSKEFPINENNEIIFFKKCCTSCTTKLTNVIVKLRVPITEDTKIIMLRNEDGYANKMRVSSAIVDSIYDIDSVTRTIKKSTRKRARSLSDYNFLYTVGKTVYPKCEFNSLVTQQCVSGIHGFLNIKSALDYV